MSTATAFTWNFPIGETMYVFNQFTTALAAPVAIGVGLSVLFAAAAFTVRLVRGGLGR